ncbi:unnamed protein product [Ranitomeya imitator]|uniref:Lamina-associated polypeptide 2 alpha C-terminal domain-containing protein n=1 Tax=Ranitomeya imitator TaxID=111125 RepID=A0ABN9MCR3_9NEOB|nr:unnamed protein product [Ranitomeya imitator]
MMEMVKPSLDEAFVIQEQNVALNFIGSRGAKPGVTKEKRIKYAKEVLQKEMLPHVGRTRPQSKFPPTAGAPPTTQALLALNEKSPAKSRAPSWDSTSAGKSAENASFPLFLPGDASTGPWDIVQKHRENPDKRFTAQKATEAKYPFSKDLMKELLLTPSVDPAVSRLASKTILSLTVHRSKTLLTVKLTTWLAQSLRPQEQHSCSPSFAATWVAKAMAAWAEVLTSTVHGSNLPPEAARLANQIAQAGDFVVNASIDAANCTVQASANAISIRRALWLRDWRADSASKKSLASLPYHAGRLFGEKLDQIISDATGGRKKFLPQQKPTRPFRMNNSFDSGPFVTTPVGHPLTLVRDGGEIEIPRSHTDLTVPGNPGMP